MSLVERLLGKPEPIGNPDCPLMLRWTVLAGKLGKLLIHRFMPDVQDPDVHDHPRPLFIFVLWGGYDDFVPCCACEDGWERRGRHGRILSHCRHGDGSGMVLGERMRAGTVRYRPARHAHATHAGADGAWTLCIMGPVVREWGFWIGGKWEHFRHYIDTRGFVRRCPADDRDLADLAGLDS